MVGNQKSLKRDRKLIVTWKAKNGNKFMEIYKNSFWCKAHHTRRPESWSLWKSCKTFLRLLFWIVQLKSETVAIRYRFQGRFDVGWMWCRFVEKSSVTEKNIKRIKKKTMGLSAWKQKRHFLVKYSMRLRLSASLRLLRLSILDGFILLLRLHQIIRRKETKFLMVMANKSIQRFVINFLELAREERRLLHTG